MRKEEAQRTVARPRNPRSPSPADSHEPKRAINDDEGRDRSRRDGPRDSRWRSRSPVDVRSDTSYYSSYSWSSVSSDRSYEQRRYRDRDRVRDRGRDRDRDLDRDRAWDRDRNRDRDRDRDRDRERERDRDRDRDYDGRRRRSRSRSPLRRRNRSRDDRDDRDRRDYRPGNRRDASPERLQSRRMGSAGTASGSQENSKGASVASEKSEADKKAERLAKLEAWKKKHEKKTRTEPDTTSNKTPPKPASVNTPETAPKAAKEAPKAPETPAAPEKTYAGKFDPKAIAKKAAARHQSPGPLRPVIGQVPGFEKPTKPVEPTKPTAALSANRPFSGFGFGKGTTEGAASKRKLDLDDEEISKRKLAKLPDMSLEEADNTPYAQDDSDDDSDDGRFAGTEEEFAAAARAARDRREERLLQQSMAMDTDESATKAAEADSAPADAEKTTSAVPLSASAAPEPMQVDEPAAPRSQGGAPKRRMAAEPKKVVEDDDVDPLDAFMADLGQAQTGSTKRKDKKSATEPEAYFSDDDDYFAKAQDGIDTKSILAIAAKRKKKDIPTIDYSKLELTPVRKNFWVEPHELSELTEAEVAELRLDLDGIKVTGKDVPKPVQKWSQCGLTRPMLEVIERLGYDKPTSIQMQALPVIMSGRDVIGVAKTGSGKTMAFLVPMFRHIMDQERVKDDGPIGLVLTPTRELAVQIHRDCKPFAKMLGLRTVCAYGGPPIKDQIAELKRGAEIVVATTGRMIDLLAANQGRVVSLKRTTYIVLDEADRMFDMGFEPQVMKIFANVRPDRQTLLFSATMPRIIDALVKKVLHSPVEITVGGKSVVAPEITQIVELHEEKDKFLRLLGLLGELYVDDEDVRALVFVERQEKADDLLRELLRKGYACMSLHGGKDQADRDSTISDFKNGVCPVLIATSVAARGLDVKQLKLVVNYDAPNHMEDYVHRAGRTGRAGNTGTAVTFVTTEQESSSAGIAKALEQSGQPVPDWLAEMRVAWRDKVKAGKAKDQSGFGGKGLEKLDKEREAARLRERKSHKAEGDDDDFHDKEAAAEDEKKNKAAATLAQSAASVIVSRDAKASGGSGNATPGGAGAGATDANGGALEKAVSAISDINARLARAGQLRPGQPVDNKGPDAGAFHATLEINDFPQKARWAVTNRTNVAKILDSTGVSITTKGTFYPAGKEPAPGAEAKLYLLIEGDTELAVGNAMTELTRLLREGTVAAADAENRAPASGRYTVT